MVYIQEEYETTKDGWLILSLSCFFSDSLKRNS